MRFKLVPGEELDAATPQEVRDIFDAGMARWRRGPETIHDFQAVTLDGSGDGDVTVYRCPVGQHFTLHRLLIDAEGYDPGTPYTSSTGYLWIQRNGFNEDFLALSDGLPAVLSSGDDDGIKLSNGETLDVSIVGGPADGGIVFRLQGTLAPLTVG